MGQIKDGCDWMGLNVMNWVGGERMGEKKAE